MKKKIFLLVLLLLCVGILNAAILNVPVDYATIQAGMNAANTHDTVLVDTGTYIENINYNGKNITVASLFLTTQDTSYISQTVIDGDSLDSVVKFINGEDSTAVLCGLTITKGNACGTWPDQDGGGILCKDSSPKLLFLIIINNNAVSYGGGVSCANSSMILESVTIKDNNANLGGGLRLAQDSSPRLTNVTIKNNNAWKAAGIYCGSSSLYLFNVVISYNNADNVGGIYCNDSSFAYLENVKITENNGFYDSFYGGGVHCEFSSMDFKNCEIIGNYSEHYGGGACFKNYSIITMENVLIKNNTSYSRGGGILFANHSFTNMKNVEIANNNAKYGGGIYFSSYCETVLENVSITRNYAKCWGGGLYSVSNIDLEFSSTNRCNIYSNIIENSKGFGCDIFFERPSSSFTTEIIVDTFTVLTPTDYYASPIEKITFDIQHFVQTNLINSNLYVSVNGDDSNSGLSADDPFKTIRHALNMIYSDSANINTIHISSGTYSSSTNGEDFPILWSNYVNLSGDGIDETILDADTSYYVLGFYGVSTAMVEDVTLTEGYFSYGGGIFCCNSSPTIKNVKICNSTSHYGGAIGCIDSNPILIDVLMTNNYAVYGGGLACYTGSYPILKNVTISSNICEEQGGGIYCKWDSYPIIINSVISDNYGQYGIYISDWRTEISYSNFYNNEYGNFSAGVNDSIGVNVTTNANGDSCDAFYNIQLDPLFVDPANNDYHLSWTNYPIPDSTMSPCIDAGDPNSPLDPDGTIADMGAYYFNQNVSVDEQEENSQNTIWSYPNPTQNSTTILYSLKKNSHVMISIYNIKGQLVTTLVDATKPKGEYSVEFEIKALSSGLYFYKMQTEDKSEIKKMIVIK